MIRLGAVGTGGIATRFAEAVRLFEDDQIVAMASRLPQRAESFGERFGMPARHGGDESMAEDPNVDDTAHVAT